MQLYDTHGDVRECQGGAATLIGEFIKQLLCHFVTEAEHQHTAVDRETSDVQIEMSIPPITHLHALKSKYAFYIYVFDQLLSCFFFLNASHTEALL